MRKNNFNQVRVNQAIKEFERSKKELTNILYEEGKIGQDDDVNQEYLKIVNDLDHQIAYPLEVFKEKVKKLD